MQPLIDIARRVQPRARIRLYCFPYAGGGINIYSKWQNALGPEVEVCAIQLPGRGQRLHMKPISQLAVLVDALARSLIANPCLPFAFFGHSLGALVAFEVTRYCQRHRLKQPLKLFVSGCVAPWHRTTDENLHLLDDIRLIDALRAYNGTPLEILEHRELMQLMLPAIRADFEMVATYKHFPSPQLDASIRVLVGKDDPLVPPDQALDWKRVTSSETHVEWFSGDHFFIHTAESAVLSFVQRELANMISTRHDR
jgi:surfactin synthase thioesterase subunit